MITEKETVRSWNGVLVFSAAFALTFAVERLTLPPGVGPGSAGAWAAGALGQGNGGSAVLAPLFRLVTALAAKIGPLELAAQRLNVLTLIGHSLLAGVAGLGLQRALKSWKVWGASSLAAWGGALVGITRLGWASALLVNPATWSLAALAVAWLLLLFHNQSDTENENGVEARRLLLACWSMGLAVTFHIFALVAFPAFFLVLFGKIRKVAPQVRGTAAILFFAPFTLFLIPAGQPFFRVTGLLVAPPGVPELTGITLVGWSALFALTPVALLFALWGAFRLLKREPRSMAPLLLLLAGIAAGGLLGGEAAEYSALLVSVLVAVLTVFGLADLLQLLPGGPALLLWVLLPLLWWFHGVKLSRASDVIWRTHVDNVIRTVRTDSFVLSLDDALINAPYAYLRAAERMRPDITLVQPANLVQKNYLARFGQEYAKRIEPVRDSFDSLFIVVSRTGADPVEKRAAADSFLADLVRQFVKRPGVLMTAGYTPPVQGYEFIPEGLLVRIQGDSPPFPFQFSRLEMGPIRFEMNAPLLRQRLVAMYPMMFTSRASWMLQRQFIAEGTEYVRWALKIDPEYIPAKILAMNYGITGPPQR